VEYTVFSEQLLATKAEYTNAIERYLIDCLGVTHYTVTEKEFGVIPMTDHLPSTKINGRVLHIGTVGGTVKASSGYGFKSTRQRTRTWVRHWAQSGQPDMRLLRSTFKYRWFDSILLQVLQRKWMNGKAVFSAMFQNLPATVVFRFLDEKSHLGEELRIMWSVPTWPFVAALFARLRAKIRAI
jgi:lycopene beta-cyclase